MNHQESVRGKVMFLSEACVLDPNSGAAIEMWTWLQVLQSRGFSCSSVSMSLFDGKDEFPVKKEIFPDLDFAGTVGQRIRSEINGIEHNIFNTGTSIGPKISVELVNGFVNKPVNIFVKFCISHQQPAKTVKKLVNRFVNTLVNRFFDTY